MDKLDTLKGIGRATAERLEKAGIDSFAKLAAATDEQLQAIEQLPGDLAAWTRWREEAKARGAAPRPMTAEELAALARQWDEARAAVKAAGDAVAALQADPQATSEALEAARRGVLEAQARLGALTPLPEGITLPPASPNKNTLGTGPATPAQASPAPQLAQGANTPREPSLGGSNPAAPATGAVELEGVCITNVRWQGETHLPQSLLKLPKDIALALQADGALQLMIFRD